MSKISDPGRSAQSWGAVRSKLSLNEDRVQEHYGYALSRLRRDQELTQQVVASSMGVSQARVSKIEHGDVGSTEVGTLANYVAALGGRLKLVVELNGKDLQIG